MSNKRICFLSSMHPLRDKRVFDKEAAALAAAGYDVVHLAPGAEDAAASAQGVQLVPYRKPRTLIGRLLQLPALYRHAVRTGADVYHCNEMDSWTVGVALKLLHGKPVVFDVHEHYPSTFADNHFPRWLAPVIGLLVRMWIRLLLPFTDRIVLAKRSVAGDFRAARRPPVLVENFTPLAAGASPAAADAASPAPLRAPFPVTAVHLGLISRVRGWPQLLDALARMEHQEVGLWVIGTFNDNSRADFDQRVQELGLKGRIHVEDWLPFEQVLPRLQASHIGLVLFQPGVLNHVMASPHKLFDYMRCQLPVVAPDFAIEVAAVIREAECGILVDPSRPEQIARALDELAEDLELRTSLGINGSRAVHDRYNWEHEASKLVGLYQELFTGSASVTPKASDLVAGQLAHSPCKPLGTRPPGPLLPNPAWHSPSRESA